MTALQKMAASYREQYGNATDDLFRAMAMPHEKIALLNPFIAPKKLDAITSLGHRETVLDSTFYRLPTDCSPASIEGLMSHYFLDRSSVFPPLLLPLARGMRVLDMCSAPGGKLLVMLSRQLNDVRFTANDISSARSNRLRRILKEYLLEDFLGHIQVTTKDAAYFGLKAKNLFDAVLLDAPCSSEAHVVKDPSLLNKFAGLSKSLPMRQYSLLCSALLAVKPGGYVMYATCSINKNENEGIIEKLQKKKGSGFSLADVWPPMGERGPYGVTILPHLHGAGPAFFSLIKKH